MQSNLSQSNSKQCMVEDLFSSVSIFLYQLKNCWHSVQEVYAQTSASINKLSQMLPTPESKLCQLHLCLNTAPASKVLDKVSWPVQAVINWFIHVYAGQKLNPCQKEPYTKLVLAKSLDSKNTGWKDCTLSHLNKTSRFLLLSLGSIFEFLQ